MPGRAATDTFQHNKAARSSTRRQCSRNRESSRLCECPSAPHVHGTHPVRGTPDTRRGSRMLQPRLSGSLDTHTRRSTGLHRLQTMHRRCSSTSITATKAINRRAQNPMRLQLQHCQAACRLAQLRSQSSAAESVSCSHATALPSARSGGERAATDEAAHVYRARRRARPQRCLPAPRRVRETARHRCGESCCGERRRRGR